MEFHRKVVADCEGELIHTARLDLRPLADFQLRLLLEDPPALERGLGIRISREVVTDRVVRAVRMKLAKMERADPARHPWYTYWLLVIRDEFFGAGLLGYKGPPDGNGEVEIGYGIDPLFQNRGFTTEAVAGMIGWAFAEKGCRVITAKGVQNANRGSRRVLEKAGLRPYERDAEASSYRILRQEFEPRAEK
jgi:ribosomal-protein-alanine N-acetyltransferase